jgi:predicted membrane protein
MRRNHNGLGLWPGLLLLSVGGGLLGRELGLLPPHVRVWDFWPLFIVLIGVSVLLGANGIVSALLAVAFIGLGAVLLAGNLGFLASSVTRFWPVLVMLLGIGALVRGRREPEPPPPVRADEALDDEPSWEEPELVRTGTADADRISRQYTCSGAELRIESQAWKGGDIGVTAGGVELDLRQARLAPEGAVLRLRVLMGGVEIRVPDTWQVHFDVMPFFGGADDSTRSTQGAGSGPRLSIVGNVTLGGVNVSN